MAKLNSIVDVPVIQYQIGPKTTHVRHDTAHCLAPGLFRSLKKGDRKKQKLHVVYWFGEKEYIEFRGFEPLGAEDVVVLQGLGALSALGEKQEDGTRKRRVLTPKVNVESAIALRKGLELEWQAVNQPSLVVVSSFRNLAKEIGYDPDSGGDLKTISKSVDRLLNVSVFVQKGSERWGFNLISAYKCDLKTGKLFIALNPRITEAIMGKRSHTRISMDEVRKIKSDPARILHQRLCAIISPGSTKKILPQTVASYIWPDESTGSTKRMRMMTLRKALTEIVATGAWEVKEGYSITRKGDFKKMGEKKRGTKKQDG